MRRINLNSGTNAILIAHLRQLGGSAEVNCAEFSIQHNFCSAAVYQAARFLEKAGLLTMQKRGYARPPVITLNEAAIQKMEKGGSVPAVAKIAETSDNAISMFKKIFAGVQYVFISVASHEFVNESGRQLIDPLLDIATLFMCRFEELCHKLENCVADISKLTEAAEGLNAEDEQIKQAKMCDLGEMVKAVDFEELPAVPIINFSKLLSEPANFFKQLATLQAKTRELRNLLVEMQRESIKLNLAHTKLSAFVDELQIAEPVIDFSKELAEWQKKSDRYFSNLRAVGTAVVSTKQ